MRSLNFLFIGAFSIGASLAVIYYEFFILRSIRSANVNTHSSCYASGWGANKIYSSDRELLIEANMKYFPPQDRYDSSEMFLGTKLNRNKSHLLSGTQFGLALRNQNHWYDSPKQWPYLQVASLAVNFANI